MEYPVTVSCNREFDPPNIVVTVTATGNSYPVSTGFYEFLRAQAPDVFPPNPCS